MMIKSFLTFFVFAFMLFIPVFGNELISANHSSSANNGDLTSASDSTSIRTKTNHSKPMLIAKLPAALKEVSGMVFFDTMLWVINDGGNPAQLYQIDTTTGSILRTVTVGNAINSDWESITDDGSNVYIGDFGNNSGNRTDLKILKIAKAELTNPSTDTVNAGIIHFSYTDQRDFTSALNFNNFDCEAFCAWNDSLHLFSKNWGDQLSRHYIMPCDTGKYKATCVEIFEADGLITDATITVDGKLVLLGYKNTRGKFWKCFCWVLKGKEESYFFDGSKTRIELGSVLRIGQTEGIAFENANRAWLTSEGILCGKWCFSPKLLEIDLKKYLDF